MNTWIVSESDFVTARIRKSLQKLEIECPLAQIICSMSVRSMTVDASQSGMIVFFATENLIPEDFEVLRNLRAHTEAKLVVVASVSDHSVVLKAIRAGADDYLNADGNLDDEIADLVSRISSERIRPAAEGRMISIVPCHVPTDASVLSVNVSTVIAQHVGECALLDFQMRGGDLAMLLKLDPRHTLFDLITQPEGVDEAMFQQALTPHESGVQLLAGPPLFSNFAQMQSHVCQHILGLARSTFPFVVVNSEDILHAEQIRALAGSDEIVLTMRLDVVSLHRAKQHLEYLKRNQVPVDHVHIVAIGTGHTGELPVTPVKKILGVSDIHCVPDDPVASIASVNVGNPLVLESPKSKCAQAITNIAATLSRLPDIGAQVPKRWKLPGIKAASF